MAHSNAKDNARQTRQQPLKLQDTKSTDELLAAKSLRRFDANKDAWGLNAPQALTERTQSSRAKSIQDLKHLNLDNVASGSRSFTLRSSVSVHGAEGANKVDLDKQLNKTQRKSQGKASISVTTPVSSDATPQKPFRDKVADFLDDFKDKVRKIQQSSPCDPYVKVTLKPSLRMVESFQTKVIIAGGANVQFDFGDENEHTFLLRDSRNDGIDALKNRYLKIEVYDYETGANDRLLGTARIVTDNLAKPEQVNKTCYARLNLYENDIATQYAWAGTVDIAATLRRVDFDEAEQIAREVHKKIENKMVRASFKTLNAANLSGIITNRGKRGMTDQIVLNRIGSHGGTVENAQIIQEEKDYDEFDSQYKETLQGKIISCVLFLSLLLSGTLFFGAMDEYEVMAQREFMFVNHGTKFSIIDTLHWSLVTASTVGYGDMYPQTTGGRVFASFFIVFGVTLLMRLLFFIQDYVQDDFLEQTRRRLTVRKKLTWDHCFEWDIDGDNKISKYEFLRGMLLKRGDTDVFTIEQIMDLFDKYDKDGDGEIEIDELKHRLSQRTEELQNAIASTEKQRGNDAFQNEQGGEHHLQPLDEMDANDEDDEVNGASNSNFLYQQSYEEEEDEQMEYALHVDVLGCDHLKEFEGVDGDDDAANMWSLIRSWFYFLLFLLLGTMIFSFVEQRPFGDMLWMCVVTVCTVGYGDVYPETRVGKVLNAFFIAVGVMYVVARFYNDIPYLYEKQERLDGKRKKKLELLKLKLAQTQHTQKMEHMIKQPTLQDLALKEMMKSLRFKTILYALWPSEKIQDREEQGRTDVAGSTSSPPLRSAPPEKTDSPQKQTRPERKKVDLDKVDTKRSSKKLDLFGDDDEDENDDGNANKKQEYRPKFKITVSETEPRQKPKAKTDVLQKLDVKKSSAKLDIGLFDEEDEETRSLKPASTEGAAVNDEDHDNTRLVAGYQSVYTDPSKADEDFVD